MLHCPVSRSKLVLVIAKLLPNFLCADGRRLSWPEHLVYLLTDVCNGQTQKLSAKSLIL